AFAGGHAAKLDVPSGAYQMDPTHASVTWRIGHLGLSNYTARFTKFDIKLDLNAEDPTKSTVTATVDPTSVETDYSGSKDFNGEIATGAKFLDGGAHPEITFTSKSIELGDGKTGTMTGDVTLLGVTKPVTFDVTLNGALKEHPFAKKPAVGFGATGTIKRSEFGLTHLIPFVSDEVDVIIEAEFLKQ
ncbi:MAG: YceI family protein, partial [Pseudomonadota bacterium]